MMFFRPTLATTLSLLLAATAAQGQDSVFSADLQKSLITAIARAERSVVAIARVRKKRPDEAANFELRFDPFGRQTTPPVTSLPTDPDFVPTEYATGVVVDPHGLVLTTSDALADESDYYVTTCNHKVYQATVKGADPRGNLAILAINADHLPPIVLGDAATLEKGMLVVALGNPYAIARDGQASASWGIVSNLQRKPPPLLDNAAVASDSSRNQHTLHEFGTLIQTDARLNQGTDGGALINMQGEMVGLTVALATTAGYERGAGYAIPVDATFRRALKNLEQGQEVEYGFLGIRPTNLKPEEALQGKQGIRVQSVVQGSPAEHAGMKPDDIITAVGDRPIHNADDLMLEVGRMPAGALIHFSLLRSDQPMQIKVALTKYPVSATQVVTTPRPAWRGLRVDYTTAGADPEGSGPIAFSDGVIVTDVVEGLPASRAGLLPGMRITQVEHTTIHTPQDFLAAVAGKNGPVQLHVVGQNSPSTITVEPEK